METLKCSILRSIDSLRILDDAVLLATHLDKTTEFPTKLVSGDGSRVRNRSSGVEDGKNRIRLWGILPDARLSLLILLVLAFRITV